MGRYVVTLGTFPRRALVFCGEGCAGRWALVEAARLRGWLSVIAARSRGAAVGLASQALFSNVTAAGAPAAEEGTVDRDRD